MDAEIKKIIEQRINFMARSGKRFDCAAIALRKYLGMGMKHSYHRIPDKVCHYVHDAYLALLKRQQIEHLGNAFHSLAKADSAFEQHPLHRGFFYDQSRHSLVGTATGIDINVSNGKHHLLELNRSVGLLEIIRPIYKTKYGPEIYAIVAFAKKYQFKKVYVMYSRLHLYKTEIENAAAEYGVDLIPVSYPWVEFDQHHSHYFMPDQLERDTLYMRLEPGYSPIMHYLTDKYVSCKWLKSIAESDHNSFSLVNIPTAANTFRINTAGYSMKWPNLVIKLSGKMQGRSIFMVKADSEEKAMAALAISQKDQMPSIFAATGTEKIVDRLFGYDTTVVYQDFVQPSLKDGKAGRIRLNVFTSPLTSFSLSDYYMWTVFSAPEKCPEGLLSDPQPYIVNWAFSGKRAEFAELSREERYLTDAAIPQICRLIQLGLGKKFIS